MLRILQQLLQVYLLEQTYSDGRSATVHVLQAKSDVTITVSELPTPSDAGADQELCDTDNTTLSANTPTVGTGLWTVISGTAVFADATNPTTPVTGLSTGANVLRWTISNGSCTPSTSEVTITVYEAVTNNLISSDQTILNGEIPAELIGSLPVGGNSTYDYQWQSSTNGGLNWNDITSATGQNFQPGALSQTTLFRRVVSSANCADVISNTVLITVDPATDLAILKTVNNNAPNVGDNIVFQLSVTNNGPSSATNVEVNDLLPNGYNYVSDNGAGAYNSATGIWTIGNLGVGANITLEITASVNASGDFTNVAIVSGDETDPILTNNQSSVTVNQVNVIVANDDPETINGFVGGSFNVLANDTYNANPATTGEVTITQLTIDAGLNFNLATGEVTVSAGTSAGVYTLTYRLTDNIDAANTDDATVTVTVTAAAIDAVDDDVTGINGKEENLGVVNVLANDRLNGVAVVPSDVTLSRTSPVVGSPLTLNADGSVDVAAETAAGTYTLTYEISENLNPTNTDQATVTVEVVAPAIVANDDTFGPVNAFDGGTAGNVLANDTYNGAGATLTNTALVVVSADVPLTLDLLTGEIDVAAGTVAGTYTLEYTLVDQLNPTNTDNAVVTVTVEGPVMEANTDNFGPINGFEGVANVGNILTNDTYNGATATVSLVDIAIVTPFSNGNVTLDITTGQISVAAGTAAGTYTLEYSITDKLDPSNVETATVTVEVVAAAIEATDDTFGPVNAFDGGVAGNVLVNDTYNGAGARLTETELVFVSSTDPAVTLDLATGEISVAAGTVAGTYTLEYTLVDQLNPTNTDNAVVTVTVEGPLMEANADNFGPINGFEGVANVGNILTNDTYNGATATVSEVDIAIVTPFSNANVTLDITTGQISVAAGTAAGTYTLEYSITDKLDPSNVETATVTVEVAAAAIEAVDDTFGPVNAFDGGVAGNVLVNDTYNGAGARLTETELVFVSSTDPAVTLDLATGEISVAAGTVAGTYTLEYTLVDQLNPTNTDNAVVTVTVEGPVMEANTDNFGPINGFEGVANVGNILTNDTYNGATATVSLVDIAIVTPFSNGNVTLDITTGQISVAAGTAAGTYTLEYSITDKLDPSNVETATVTVEVVAAAIEATDDTFGPVNAFDGGVAGNVLTNDTYNGAGARLTETELVFVSSTDPAVTLDLATGEISVAAGTAAGTYTLEYTLVDQLNPTNTDNAVVTVTVEGPVMEATADNFGPINGFEGVANVGNILTNDTYNGATATVSEVDIAIVTPFSNTNVALDVTTGQISVAAGTAAGTYTLEYSITDKLDPSNVETATVTVEVAAAAIEAVDDTFGPVNAFDGGVAGNVLVNDTYNGAGARLTETELVFVSSTDPAVTLDLATGEISVAAGTVAGTYTLEYTLVDQLNPTNTDNAVVTVTVEGPLMEANADNFGPINGFEGVANVGNILTNDTYNGATATVSEVDIAIVTPFSNANVTLDITTGQISVAAGTAAGTYTLEYSITDKLDPSNVETATVTVEVAAAAIEAVDDTFGPVNAFDGGVAGNVLVNDTYNGAGARLTETELVFVSSTDPAVTLDLATGEISVAAGTVAGTYTLEYTLVDQLNPTNTDNAVVTVTVEGPLMEANADNFGPINGFEGVANVGNILTNDTYNGATATVSEVDIAIVTPFSNANVALDVTTGQISVAAGTAAGTYTLEYSITDKLDPSNVETATVTVEVAAAAIEAVDDTFGPVNAFDGGVAGNVLVNDTYNGAGARLTETELVFVSSTDPAVTLDLATGEISVAAGTVAGTYTLEYTLVDQLNPTNTDNAVVTVTVEGPVMEATADNFGPINGFEGVANVGNILTNDTYNGATATVSEVDIAIVTPFSNTNVALDVTTGQISVAAGTAAGTYTLEYSITDKLDPSNVETATVTVEVAAAAIEAVDDTFGPVNAFDGGVAGNVLVNDTYNGAGARLTETELVFVSSTDPAVTLDLATGEISVAAGTAAGTYTLEYTLVDQLNPTNTDNAVVTVTVEGPVMEATADNFGPINGFEGVANVGNILTNDTYNGATATVSEVDIAIVTPFSNTNVALDVTTGQISVAAGTAAGTYTLEYSITDKLDPSNVETATVTVEVAAAAIEAVDDTFGPVNAFDGGVAGNVLVNDTYNGAGARLTETELVFVSSTDPAVTLDLATGEISVAAGTAAGTYTLEYTLVDQLNPTNTDNAVVTVTVEGPVMEATADNFGAINGFEGVANVGNILTNDTYNGATATVSLVDIAIVTPFSNTNVALDVTTGQISVAAGTAAGTYTLEYSITDKLDPSNVETATVTVEVIAAEIEAINDNASGINGKDGATAVVNVLANDLLNGVAVVPADVTITRISPVAGSPLTLNADGSVDVASMTAAGTYTLTYEISENLNPSNTDQAIVTVIVEAAEIIANDDLVENINGFTGSIDVGINILVNDLLNGVAVIPTEVTIAPNTNGPLTVNADGTVSVDANTPAGTYSVTYVISEKLNPSNTATATVTVEVVAPVIEANDDSFGTINGFEGGLAGNVLTNDRFNGTASSINDVTLNVIEAASNTNVVLDINTGLVKVSPLTPAGNYTIKYRKTDKLNADNSDEATVFIEVLPAPILAIEDDFRDVDVFEGRARAQIGNIFENDAFNEQRLDLSNVTVSIGENLGRVPDFVVIDDLGNVSVLETATPGVYTFDYTICSTLNPSSCSTASVTILVQELSIDMSISKSSFNAEIFEGTNYEYEILVENNSDFDATNVVIRDLMPNNATLVNVEYRVTNSRIVTERRFEGTDIIFEVADFPRGEQLLIILTVNAGNFGPVVNEVTVTAKENDNRPNNNRSIDRNEIKPFFIPDVITPGRADGKNDRFVINGLQKFEKNKLVIINRWNDHVYQSENYQNDWSANGLNAGTYYYVLTSIDGQGKEHIFKGWIQVIK